MSNFELIDDYLSNRLSEQEKKAFEQQLHADPALKSEVELQQKIVDGVRRARAMELKTMLNNVPVGTSFWTGGKFAATVASVGLVATVLYFYTAQETSPVPPQEQPKQEIATIADSTASVVEVPQTMSVAEDKEQEEKTSPTAEKGKTKPSAQKKSTPVQKPSLDVIDPSDDFKESTDVKESSSGRSSITPSKMEVITGVTDKKHNFHYQFVKGKLMLFGPFDKSLYEILEIHGEGHAVFLFYKENYYLLDESQSKITELQPIKDGQLLNKLKEYRGQ